MKHKQLTVVSQDYETGNVCFWDYRDCTVESCLKEFREMHEDHNLCGVFVGENLDER